MKGYTDFWMGFLGPELVATKPIGKMKYFNWNKAIDIIKEHLDADEISIGLLEDWNNTSGIVYETKMDGRRVFYPNEYTYTQSTWATPIIDIDGEEIECWTYNKEEAEGDLAWLVKEIQRTEKDTYIVR